MYEVVSYLCVALVSGWLGWHIAFVVTKKYIVDPMVETKSIKIKGTLYHLTPAGKIDV